MKRPYISPEVEEAHRGDNFIAYDDKVLGWGKDAMEALKEARKVMPDIDDKVFYIGTVYHKNLAY